MIKDKRCKYKNEETGELIISDMSCCQPCNSVSRQAKAGCWQLVPYTTCGTLSGKMVFAPSFNNAPEITLPLNVAGWHAISILFWNPNYVYDGGMTLKVKLDNDPVFIRIRESEPPIDSKGTYIKEAFFRHADLTGRSLVFGKMNGPMGEKACVAAVRLVPLNDQQTAAVKADRDARDRRVLQASIDGMSYLFWGEYRTREHILEQVEPYRFSDVGKVYWAVNYGEVTNYPSKVGIFLGEAEVPIREMPARNGYVAGEKTMKEAWKQFVENKTVPEDVVADYVHKMGLKFDAMFRLAILGPLTPMRRIRGASYFMDAHPEFRQLWPDGTPVQKASYAFPEVRAFMVSIIKEAMERFDFDGANLCFVRGPRFVAYEEPVLAEFRRQYGEDARRVPAEDARLQRVWCQFVTEFVREARRAIDDIGKKKGRKLELSALVYGRSDANPVCGFDVETWAKERLLDTVVTFCGEINPLDKKMIEMVKGNGCRLVYGLGWGVSLKHELWAPEVLKGYAAGLDEFFIWDLDGQQDDPTAWSVGRRIGHRDEMKVFAAAYPQLPTFKLKRVDGYDVDQSLGETVYSGG